MLHLVFLPATEPGDETFGVVPERIEACPGASVHQVHYAGMVWYNEHVRQEAIAQIRALELERIVLVGFSKSGLGAWNIARTIPGLVSGTIIFDAPVARENVASLGARAFYTDDPSWRRDLPIHTVQEYGAAMPGTHSLVLISGGSFHQEVYSLSQALSEAMVEHVFLPRPHLEHHWNSGWIEEGLTTLSRRRTIDAN